MRHLVITCDACDIIIIKGKPYYSFEIKHDRTDFKSNFNYDLRSVCEECWDDIMASCEVAIADKKHKYHLFGFSERYKLLRQSDPESIKSADLIKTEVD